ncbi:MAG: adenosylcobinamide-GDP ribazoletransferase [Sphaerochaetaceae bacterium]|jgi:adenosylcobinamide-GDP ribazoletransferase|nr:adenosylcobinamide-GDP ribazoletransferase [Sphaerochaetaceae bacterium]
MKKGMGLASAMWTLSRFPFPGKPCREAETTLYWFGFSGAVIGLAASIPSLLIGLLAPMPLLQAALFTALMAYFTRGFHLDGLGDMADGFGGGFSREKTLEIMSDSHSGSFAVIAISCCLLLKAFSAAELLRTGISPLALIVPASWARTAIVLLCFVSSYAKPEGKARAITDACTLAHLAISLVTSAAFSTILMLTKSCSILVAAAPAFAMIITVFVLNRVSNSRIGGITGDVCGACCEITETASIALMAIAAAI